MVPEGHNTNRHRSNLNLPGHAHELTFSCYKRYPFFNKERVCFWLVDAIARAREEVGFELWAWVFMPDHVHLIVKPQNTSYDMGLIRRRIKEPVGRCAIAWIKEHAPEWEEKLSRRRGDKVEYLFWQSGGGYDRNITDASTLLRMIDYIHANPVRKRLVGRASDWKWSSAAWYTNGADVPLTPDSISPEWLNY